MSTTEQPTTADDVKALVEERAIRFIRFWFTDILGQLKSFSINAAELDDAFEGGMGFDGSSITGFNAIEESDMIAMPDASTFAVLPWRPDEQGVARMFCDIQTPERTPYEGDPRHVLRRALERANAMGFDTFNVGPELEYFLFKDKDSTEVLDEGGYFDLTTLDAGSDVRRETVLALEQLGIHVEYTHHEVGPSQHEIDMRYANALKMADDCMTYRITVKEYAMKYGWHATFMPKPLFGENGSGMHTHMSLFSEGKNAMFDADDAYFLSDVGKAFIAGQLKQAPGARLRGAGLRRMVAAQPLGARARPALPPGQGAGHAHGAALPGPRLQPLSDLRRPPAGRPRGHREGLRAARADGEEPLPPGARRP
jgi:glutamine synthetase